MVNELHLKLHILMKNISMRDMKCEHRSKAVPTIRTPQAADWALSRGITALTTAEVAQLLGIPASQVPQRMAVPMRRHEWVTPARGLWVPVSPDYRAWGGPPALEFVPDLMGFLGADYYIGWLSAAALFGAAHQAPQVTQIATSRMIRNRQVGRARLEFYTRSGLPHLPVIERTVRTGRIRVAPPELTALDLAANVMLGGGLDNVATVIVELSDNPGLDLDLLARTACGFSAASARRVGWILDEFTGTKGLGPLMAVASAVDIRPSPLNPLSGARGKIDKRWQIRINQDVQVEA